MNASENGPLSPGQIFRRRFSRHRMAVWGLRLLVVFYVIAFLADFIAPHHFETQDRDRFFHPPTRVGLSGIRPVVYRHEAVEGAYRYAVNVERSAPLKLFAEGDEYRFLGLIATRRHLLGTGDKAVPFYPLGTDQYGRCVCSRLLYGARISLSIGLVGILISFTIALIIGGAAGYFGGWVDSVSMRGAEFMMSMPTLYLIIALRVTFPPEMSSTEVYLRIIAVLSLVGWAGTSRVIRGMGLSLRERQYVLAARSLGASSTRVILRHVLPGTFSYVIVAATLMVPYYILGEVVLSYLAVGIQEPQASWGTMLVAAQDPEHIRKFPWLLSPGAAIFATVLAFNFVGDGLRDAADTRTV